MFTSGIQHSIFSQALKAFKYNIKSGKVAEKATGDKKDFVASAAKVNIKTYVLILHTAQRTYKDAAC